MITFHSKVDLHDTYKSLMGMLASIDQLDADSFWTSFREHNERIESIEDKMSKLRFAYHHLFLRILEAQTHRFGIMDYQLRQAYTSQLNNDIIYFNVDSINQRCDMAVSKLSQIYNALGVSKLDSPLSFGFKFIGTSSDISKQHLCFELPLGNEDSSNTVFHVASGDIFSEKHCELCFNPYHHAVECATIKTAKEKYKLAKCFELCFLCLASGHHTDECQASNCTNCKGRHHASLCRSTTSTHLSSTRTEASEKNCNLCDKPNHHAVNCRTITAVNERIGRIREKKLCFRCLSINHFASNCTASECSKCQGRHHVSICRLTKSAPVKFQRARSPFRDVLPSPHTQHKKKCFKQKEEASKNVNRCGRWTTDNQKNMDENGFRCSPVDGNNCGMRMD